MEKESESATTVKEKRGARLEETEREADAEMEAGEDADFGKCCQATGTEENKW